MKKFRFALAAMLFLVALPAFAQEWKLIVSDRGRRVEVDAEHILDSDLGTKVAWSRVVITGRAAVEAGYATVKALNRYDCLNRNFSTVRRVYLDKSGKVIREEVLNDAVPVLVARNSVDERMWYEVCRPPEPKSLSEVVKAVEKAAKGQVEVVPPETGRPGSVDSVKQDVKPPVIKSAAPAAVDRYTVPPVAKREVQAQPKQPVKTAQSAAKVQQEVSPAPSPVSTKSVVNQAAHQAKRPVTPTAARKNSQEKPVAVARPVSQPADNSPDADWQYQGMNGPENWGVLRPEWELCMRGQRQAPVDLTNAIRVDLEPVSFNFQSTRLRIADTGKMLKAFVESPMDVTIRGQIYVLESVSFHRPADVLIDGRALDMSIQFLLRAPNGREAIIAVLLEQGEQANVLLQSVLNNLPLEKGEEYMPAASFDLAGSVPSDPGHFLYMGSLPQPPCTEGVVWVVMRQAMPVSAEQLAIIDRLYPNSARPVQPAHGRLILQSR